MSFSILFNLRDAAAAKSLQSCPSLCDPIDGSPPGSLVPGILRARTLEWVAISISNAWKWKVKVKSLSRVRLFVTPWTAAYQAPLSMDFPGKSTGVGCHCLLRPLGVCISAEAAKGGFISTFQTQASTPWVLTQLYMHTCLEGKFKSRAS